MRQFTETSAELARSAVLNENDAMETQSAVGRVHLHTLNSTGIVDPRVFGGVSRTPRPHLPDVYLTKRAYDPGNPLSDQAGVSAGCAGGAYPKVEVFTRAVSGRELCQRLRIGGMAWGRGRVGRGGGFCLAEHQRRISLARMS